MADLTEVYAALQKADAAGDTAGAKRLADYIRSQPKASGNSYDIGANGELVPSGSDAAKALASPVSGNNGFQNAAIGYGKFLTDMALGARQIYGSVADAISPQDRNLSSLVTGKSPSRTDALYQEAAQKRATDAPVMGTMGGKIGQFSGAIVNSLPIMAIPGANSLYGAGLVGGATGALNPVESGGDRLRNAAIGAGLAMGGKMVLDPILAGVSAARAPVQSGLTQAQQDAMESGKRLGMKFTPGQESGNVALQQIEARLSSHPMTSGPFNAMDAANQGVRNSAWAGAIGESGNAVDSTVLANANDRLGQVFENARNPNNIVAVDPTTTTAVLDQIDQGARGLLPGGASIRSNPLVSDLEGLTSQGGINGEQLGQLSSKLGKAAHKAMTGMGGDRDWGQALYAVKNHVDDLLESSLSGEDQSAYGAARQQYRALMQLTARTGNVNPSTGNVGGASFANYLQQSDRNGFLFGANQSDAYNAVRVSQAFKPVVGNSGTATRGAVSLKDWLGGIPGGLLSRGYLAAPGVARAAVQLPELLKDGAAFAVPKIGLGLPGAMGAAVPYLVQ